MKRQNIYYIAILLVTLLSASCSTTKHLPEGETLYLGLKKVTINNEDKSKAGQNALAEVEGAISIAPQLCHYNQSQHTLSDPLRTMDIQPLRAI